MFIACVINQSISCNQFVENAGAHYLLLGTLRFTERQRDGNVLRQRVN